MSDIEFKRPFRLELYKPRDPRGFTELIGIFTYASEFAARERLKSCDPGTTYSIEVKRRKPNHRGRLRTVLEPIAAGRT